MVMPRVVAGIAPRVQIGVVSFGRFRIVIAVRALWDHAVIALEDVETAFRDPGADDAFAPQAQALHSVLVDAHMGLSDQPTAHSQWAQMVAHGHFAHLQRDRVVGRAMRLHITPGIGGHAR